LIWYLGQRKQQQERISSAKPRQLIRPNLYPSLQQNPAGCLPVGPKRVPCNVFILSASSFLAKFVEIERERTYLLGTCCRALCAYEKERLCERHWDAKTYVLNLSNAVGCESRKLFNSVTSFIRTPALLTPRCCSRSSSVSNTRLRPVIPASWKAFTKSPRPMLRSHSETPRASQVEKSADSFLRLSTMAHNSDLHSRGICHRDIPCSLMSNN